MIVIYERKWEILRIEEAKAIHIIEIEKAESYSKKAIDELKKIYPDVERENVLFKDLVFDKIKRQYNITISNSQYIRMGYKYLVLIDTLWSGYTLPTKKLGNPIAIETILNSLNKIKFVKILEEEGIVEVKIKE